jgi:hypothetical protein
MAFTHAPSTDAPGHGGSGRLSRRILTAVAGAAIVTGGIVLWESPLLKQGDSVHTTRAGRSTAPVSLQTTTSGEGDSVLSRQRSTSPVSIDAAGSEWNGVSSTHERNRSTAPVLLGGN